MTTTALPMSPPARARRLRRLLRGLAPHPPLAFPGAELATALPIVGLALLVFNDAVLKNHWPGVLSGKLSNFAVMLYFPFLLTASHATAAVALCWLGRTLFRLPVHARGLTRARLAVAIALTAFAHSAVNVSTRARDVYLALLDRLDVFNLMPALGYTVDYPDLVGTVMLPVTWWWGTRLIAPATVSPPTGKVLPCTPPS